MRGSLAVFLLAVFLLAAVALGGPSAARANPTPTPGPGTGVNKRLHDAAVPRHVPTPRLPSKVQHTEFVVETNRKGQVVRVRSGKSSQNLTFNAMTYGNALQTFIRTPDGRAIAGTYRLQYDYSPSSKRVHRTVSLIRAGGVNPNAQGAVDQMADVNRKRALREQRQQAAHAAASPRASTSPLPDFRTITEGKP